MEPICTKNILNITTFCWDLDVTKELLASLFGNKINEFGQSQEKSEDHKIKTDCTNTITHITTSTIQQREFDPTFFLQMFGYNGHINVRSLCNQDYASINYESAINAETSLEDQDLILFTVSINSINLAKELKCLESVCAQIAKINSCKNHQIKLIILIDECNTLIYNEDNDVITLPRNSSESIKEDDLCSQLINLLKSRTNAYKLTSQDTFIKISLVKAATYNNFTHDLTNMTEDQIAYLGNVMCGNLVWNATKPECRVEKLQRCTINLGPDEFKYHIQNVNNTGFIKLSNIIETLILNIDSNCVTKYVASLATKVNEFIDLLLTTTPNITPTNYFVKLSENKEIFEPLNLALSDALHDGNRISSTIAAIPIITKICKNMTKPLECLLSNFSKVYSKPFLKYSETGIHELIAAYHSLTPSIAFLFTTNNTILGKIRKIIEKISQNFEPKTEPITNYFEQWFEFMRDMQDFLDFQNIVNLVPLMTIRVGNMVTPDELLTLTQEQAKLKGLNPELFYRFIQRQLMLFYTNLLQHRVTDIFYPTYYSNCTSKNCSRDLMCLITYHKINNFWNNSFLSHIINTIPSLYKLNLLASECYRASASVFATEILDSNIDMTKVYNLSLEEYLINNKDIIVSSFL